MAAARAAWALRRAGESLAQPAQAAGTGGVSRVSRGTVEILVLTSHAVFIQLAPYEGAAQGITFVLSRQVFFSDAFFP